MRAAKLEAQAVCPLARQGGLEGALPRALAALVDGRLGISSAGMTGPDVEPALRVADAGDERIARAGTVFELAEGPRYGASPGSGATLEYRIGEVRKLLGDLQDWLGRSMVMR